MSETNSEMLATIWKDVVSGLRLRLQELESGGSLQNSKVEELFENEFLATASGGMLSVWLDFASGDGSWNIVSPVNACESWKLTQDGAATLRGQQIAAQDLANVFSSMLLGRLP